MSKKMTQALHTLDTCAQHGIYCFLATSGDRNGSTVVELPQAALDALNLEDEEHIRVEVRGCI